MQIKSKSHKQFILKIEGQGQYLQNAKWAWISSVKGFDESKKCRNCLKPRKDVLLGFHKKVKVGEDYPFEADSEQMPINPKINGHNGEVPHYLCIDSTNGKDYLHIGFIYDEGKEAEGKFMGQTIIIKNAKNLDFDFGKDSEIGNKVKEKYADLADDNRLNCRNFWFGAYFYGDRI